MLLIVISILEFIIICGIVYYILRREKRHKLELKATRDDAIKRSRSALEGKIFEQIVPYLPQWKYTPSDAKFIGMPIDFIVFDGMSEGEIKSVIITEVKKGNSHTTPIQNKIKKAVEEGRVKWETLKIE